MTFWTPTRFMICCIKMNEGKPIVVVCANFWKNFCKNKNIWRNFKIGSNIFHEISSVSLQTSLRRDLQVNRLKGEQLGFDCCLFFIVKPVFFRGKLCIFYYCDWDYIG